MNKCKFLLTKQRVAMASKAKYPEIFCYCLHSTWIWLCGQGVHSGEKEICIWLLEILFLWFFSSFNLLSIINKVLESQRETAGKHQTLFPGLAARCILLSKKWRETNIKWIHCKHPGRCLSQEFKTLGVKCHPNFGRWGVEKYFLLRTFNSPASVFSRIILFYLKLYKEEITTLLLRMPFIKFRKWPASYKKCSHPYALFIPKFVNLLQAFNRLAVCTSTEAVGVSGITAQFHFPLGPFLKRPHFPQKNMYELGESYTLCIFETLGEVKGRYFLQGSVLLLLTSQTKPGCDLGTKKKKKKKEQKVKLLLFLQESGSGLAQLQPWAPAQAGPPRAWQGREPGSGIPAGERTASLFRPPRKLNPPWTHWGRPPGVVGTWERAQGF